MMQKRMIRSMLLVALLSVGLLCAFVLPRLYGAFERHAYGELGDMAQTVALSLSSARDEDAYLRGLAERVPGIRVSLIDQDGTVRYDSNVAQADRLENHAQREEITEAQRTGQGAASRQSASLGENTYYHAIRLEDGTVLRLAKTERTVFTELLGILPSIVLIALLVIGICVVVSELLIRRLLEPINSLNLESPGDNDTYAELTPLLVRLEEQNGRIARQLREMRDGATKTAAITENMAEGLILIAGDGRIVSMNASASALLGRADEAVAGRHYMLAARDLRLHQSIEQALAGRQSESRMDLNGRVYQVLASPVHGEAEPGGAVVLLLDITEHEQADTTRREFTANVSHELKTPLTTIAGYAEMMEAGLTAPQDTAQLAGKILGEARRLLMLIEDIIQLSRLDENADADSREPLDLHAIAQEAVARFGPMALKRDVQVTLEGAPSPVTGSRAQLEEMVHNLLDNAIRYNVPGGTVAVSVHATQGGCTLTVRDTGVGIAPEHHARIFERFYRVDKSHSRQTGGTGLGLSIVKHSVLNHGGTIDLQSTAGEGTFITVVLPN